MSQIRKGQAPAVLSRSMFHERFMQSFMDPAFRPEDAAISRVEAIAWDAYQQGRKAPLTRKAGPRLRCSPAAGRAMRVAAVFPTGAIALKRDRVQVGSVSAWPQRLW